MDLRSAHIAVKWIRALVITTGSCPASKNQSDLRFLAFTNYNSSKQILIYYYK